MLKSLGGDNQKTLRGELGVHIVEQELLTYKIMQAGVRIDHDGL